jgi:DNA-binding NarL/FixJ family response regulator
LIHEERLSNQQIANRLHIQVGTVKNHVHHILKKLGVHDRYEAAAAYGRWLQQEGARQAYVTL